MKFAQLFSLIYEHTQPVTIFVLEDMDLRKTLFDRLCKKILPNATVHYSSSVQEAVEFLYDQKNYSRIDAFTLDYNLIDENSVPIANLLKRTFGNDGSNVWIHSNDPEGIRELQLILPKARVAQMPNNIPEIADFTANKIALPKAA